MDIYKEMGKMALGSRLRMLGEQLMEDAKVTYQMYGFPLKPNWLPIFYVLTHQGELPVTAIAKKIKQSHPSVIKMVKEMSKAGIVKTGKDPKDARKNNIKLTKKGETIAKGIEEQYLDVGNAVKEMLKESTFDIWRAVEETEFLLEQKSMYRRIKEEKKKRETQKIKIVEYKPALKKYFLSLNQEWIEQYFVMEKADYKSLNFPKQNIINKGGKILFALYEDEPVGTCALIKMNNGSHDYELAKMSVSPKAQGKGIGFVLGEAIIQKAKSLNAKKLFLESNTLLEPAINLYKKLGFTKIIGVPSPYERCNIQMELEIS